MSAETKRALDEALQAHIASEGEGAIVTAYACAVSYITPQGMADDQTHYWYEFTENTPHHVVVGLAEMLRARLDHELRSQWGE